MESRCHLPRCHFLTFSLSVGIVEAVVQAYPWRKSFPENFGKILSEERLIFFSFAKNPFRLGCFHPDFMLCLYFHEYLLLDFRMINSQWVSLNFSEFLQCFSSQYHIQGKLASSTRIRISFQRCQKIHTYL